MHLSNHLLKMMRVKPKSFKSVSKVSVGNLDNPIDKDSKSSTKHSAWLITLSLNMSFQKGDPKIYEYGKIFQQTLDDLMSDPDELQGVLKFNMRTKNRFFDSSLSEFHVEKGPQKGFLHCHGVVSIQHRSSLQLSYIKFKQWIYR